MARQQAAKTRLLYRVLVPYREYPVTAGHLLTFTDKSFSEFLEGLIRLQVTSFATDPTAWAGRQMLVVYASQAYLRARSRDQNTLQSEQLRDWNVYFQSSPEMRGVLEDLKARCARAETALDEAILAQPLSTARPLLTRGHFELAMEKMEKLQHLRERWAPDGTQRRRWLNRSWRG